MPQIPAGRAQSNDKTRRANSSYPNTTRYQLQEESAASAYKIRLVQELRANKQLLAGQGEVSLRHAVAEERARIARDLHDSIGHHLTIIALQAGAARRLWTSEPAKARAALAARPLTASRHSS